MDGIGPIDGEGAVAGAPDSEGPALLARLAPRIRQLRRERAMTLEALAVRSGVSRAMLSKVERGEKNPSISVVTRIARGLGLSLTALLALGTPGGAGGAGEPGPVRVLRRGARRSYQDPETGLAREVLSPPEAASAGIEVVRHRIPPGRSSGPLPPYEHPISKHVAVEEGTLTLEVGGVRHVLSAGDTAWFDIETGYAFLNEGDRPLAYLLVIVRRDRTPP